MYVRFKLIGTWTALLLGASIAGQRNKINNKKDGVLRRSAPREPGIYSIRVFRGAYPNILVYDLGVELTVKPQQ